jgi:hypothetical protein
MTDTGEELRRHPAGLFARCAHHRTVGNRRGSRFYLCELSATDPHYPRYPRLPVLECHGFEDSGPDSWEQLASTL